MCGKTKCDKIRNDHMREREREFEYHL